MSEAFQRNRCWQQFKTRIKARWQGLDDAELETYRDDFNLLVKRIQKRFKESRVVVQDYVDQLWFEIYVRSARQSFQAPEELLDIPASDMRAATGS